MELMLNLPVSTILNKPLTKKALFAKFDVKPAAKEAFDADISKLVIAHEVSTTTTNIDKGKNLGAFFVLLVSLKRKQFDEKSIVMLSRFISQKMLFVLTYNDKAKLAVYHTKLMQHDWCPLTDLSIELSGSTLDAVWENIIAQVGNINVEPGNTLDEQLRLNEEREKRKKRIESLERLARAEKQPRKKFELVQEIKQLENEAHGK
jgi:hypothetical protein